MSIPQAIIGAKAELFNSKNNLQRLQLCLTYTRIIASELLQTVKIIPYGIRAKLLHNSLPPASHPSQSQSPTSRPTVTILKNQHYATTTTTPLPPRCTMDIYLPPGTSYSPPSSSSSTLCNNKAEEDDNHHHQPSPQSPIALFVHGGVWTSGEAWHYAPMATRLAQHGIITAIMQYSLYPDALMPEMVAQVNAALDYTIHHLAPNIHHHHHHSKHIDIKKKKRGKPCITLLGHSAGAQLCAMALLQRITTPTTLEADSPPSPSPPLEPRPSNITTTTTTIMPDRFIGMAGVYDLAQHYEYERSRGVHELSTMKRAAGGAALFDTQSPAVILQQLASSSSLLDQQEDREGGSCGNGGSSKRERRRSNNSSSRWKLSSVRGRFPKTTLMCSSDDLVVPAIQSVTLALIMKECGVEGVDVLKYGGDGKKGGGGGGGGGGHGGFVVDWKVKREGERGGGGGKVTRHGEDLMKLLSTLP